MFFGRAGVHRSVTIAVARPLAPRGQAEGVCDTDWGMRNVVLGIGVVVAALVMWEIGLRLIWHNPYRTEAPDHILKLRIHHPRTDHIIDRSLIVAGDDPARFRTDARSYILPSFQYENPDATIAFLGGSTTASTGVHEDMRFPALVSTLLGEQGLRVNTLNTGRASGTAHDSLNVLLNHVVRDEPDVIIMMHGGTDGRLLLGSGSYHERMGSTVSMTDMARWSLQMLSSESYIAGLVRRNLSRGSRRATRGFAKKGKERNESLPVEQFEARLRVFVAMAQAFGSVPVLVTEPRAREQGGQARINEIVRKVARDEGILLIDLALHVEMLPSWDELGVVFYDGVHANDAGSRIYAEYVTEHLLPLLR